MGWTYTFAPAKTPKGLNFGAARAYLDRVVATMADGEVCDLTISEHREKKTGQQTRAIWGTIYDQIIDGIMGEMGLDRHERAAMKPLIHEGLCGKYQGYVTDPVTKKDVRKFRLSTANKSEVSEYIEWCARFAATEYGVVIVLPGEAA